MKKKPFLYAIVAVMLPAVTAIASNPVAMNDTLANKKAEASERNVMLNASDANKPREIQIGLPSEDVSKHSV